MKRASDRIMMHGLTCYPWRLDSGRQKIEACVRGLPGPFDTDKLETLMGKDVPAWLEQLVKLEYLPIAATVTEAGASSISWSWCSIRPTRCRRTS